MIDRPARNEMASAIRSYMDEEITAFQFDDALTEATHATNDETTKSVRFALWLVYDDCKDHKIVASKELWDYLNRNLLLLESDAEIVVVKRPRRWHPRQAIAAVCLAGFCAVTWATGFDQHLLILAMPFGLVSMALAWWTSRSERRDDSVEDVTLPFPSAASLLTVRRSVPGFRRRRYPRSITGRRIRGQLLERALMLQWGVTWLMLAPLALFFQMLPRRESETIVRMPETAAAADG